MSKWRGTYKPEGHRIVTVPLPPEVHHRLRVICAHEGISIKQFVTEAIVEKFDAPRKMRGAALDRLGPQ